MSSEDVGVFSYSNSNMARPAGESQATRPAPDGGGRPSARQSASASQATDDQNSIPIEKRPGIEGARAAQEARSAPPRVGDGTLGDGVPDAVRELREERRREGFQDESKLYQNLGLEASADAAGLTGEEREKELAEQRRMLADFQLNDAEAKEVVSMLDRYNAEPPDEQEHANWYATSWHTLVRKFGGADGAKAALADAQKLIQRDPRVAAMLDATGLGSHPRIVMKAVELARTLKGQGKLR